MVIAGWRDPNRGIPLTDTFEHPAPGSHCSVNPSLNHFFKSEINNTETSNDTDTYSPNMVEKR